MSATNESRCPIEEVKKILPLDELLTQLAEEGAELVQAALKLRRAITGKNPTPVKQGEALKKLLEEIADVKLCLHVCELETVQNKIEVNRIIGAKAERWIERLENESPGCV